jgi:hypothetical protein
MPDGIGYPDDDDLPTADDVAGDMGTFAGSGDLEGEMDGAIDRGEMGFGDIDERAGFGAIDESGSGFGTIDESIGGDALGGFGDLDSEQEPLFGDGDMGVGDGGFGFGGDGGSLRDLFGGGSADPEPEPDTADGEEIEIQVGSTDSDDNDVPDEPEREEEPADTGGRTVSAASVGAGIDRVGSRVRSGYGRIKRKFGGGDLP